MAERGTAIIERRPKLRAVGRRFVLSREERMGEAIGFAVSLAIHAVLVAFVLFSGQLFQGERMRSLTVAELSFVSASEFGATISRAPEVGVRVEATQSASMVDPGEPGLEPESAPKLLADRISVDPMDSVAPPPSSPSHAERLEALQISEPQVSETPEITDAPASPDQANRVSPVTSSIPPAPFAPRRVEEPRGEPFSASPAVEAGPHTPIQTEAGPRRAPATEKLSPNPTGVAPASVVPVASEVVHVPAGAPAQLSPTPEAREAPTAAVPNAAPSAPSQLREKTADAEVAASSALPAATPPDDRDSALEVLRRATVSGVMRALGEFGFQRSPAMPEASPEAAPLNAVAAADPVQSREVWDSTQRPDTETRRVGPVQNAAPNPSLAPAIEESAVEMLDAGRFPLAEVDATEIPEPPVRRDVLIASPSPVLSPSRADFLVVDGDGADAAHLAMNAMVPLPSRDGTEIPDPESAPAKPPPSVEAETARGPDRVAPQDTPSESATIPHRGALAADAPEFHTRPPFDAQEAGPTRFAAFDAPFADASDGPPMLFSSVVDVSESPSLPLPPANRAEPGSADFASPGDPLAAPLEASLSGPRNEVSVSAPAVFPSPPSESSASGGMDLVAADVPLNEPAIVTEEISREGVRMATPFTAPKRPAEAETATAVFVSPGDPLAAPPEASSSGPRNEVSVSAPAVFPSPPSESSASGGMDLAAADVPLNEPALAPEEISREGVSMPTPFTAPKRPAEAETAAADFGSPGEPLAAPPEASSSEPRNEVSVSAPAVFPSPPSESSASGGMDLAAADEPLNEPVIAPEEISREGVRMPTPFTSPKRPAEAETAAADFGSPGKPLAAPPEASSSEPGNEVSVSAPAVFPSPPSESSESGGMDLAAADEPLNEPVIAPEEISRKGVSMPTPFTAPKRPAEAETAAADFVSPGEPLAAPPEASSSEPRNEVSVSAPAVLPSPPSESGASGGMDLAAVDLPLNEPAIAPEEISREGVSMPTPFTAPKRPAEAETAAADFVSPGEPLAAPPEASSSEPRNEVSVSAPAVLPSPPSDSGAPGGMDLAAADVPLNEPVIAPEEISREGVSMPTPFSAPERPADADTAVAGMGAPGSPIESPPEFAPPRARDSVSAPITKAAPAQPASSPEFSVPDFASADGPLVSPSKVATVGARESVATPDPNPAPKRPSAIVQNPSVGTPTREDSAAPSPDDDASWIEALLQAVREAVFADEPGPEPTTLQWIDAPAGGDSAGGSEAAIAVSAIELVDGGKGEERDPLRQRPPVGEPDAPLSEFEPDETALATTLAQEVVPPPPRDPGFLQGSTKRAALDSPLAPPPPAIDADSDSRNVAAAQETGSTEDVEPAPRATLESDEEQPETDAPAGGLGDELGAESAEVTDPDSEETLADASFEDEQPPPRRPASVALLGPATPESPPISGGDTGVLASSNTPADSAGAEAAGAPPDRVQDNSAEFPGAGAAGESAQVRRRSVLAAADALESALAALVGGDQGGAGGFGLTEGELAPADWQYLRRKLRSCWNVSPLQGRAEVDELVVVVAIDLTLDGEILGQPKVIESVAGDSGRIAARQALQALRQCAPYDRLPRDKYQKWRSLEIVFNPEEMGQ